MFLQNLNWQTLINTFTKKKIQATKIIDKMAVREYNKHMYTNKLYNLDEMEEILEAQAAQMNQ